MNVSGILNFSQEAPQPEISLWPLTMGLGNQLLVLECLLLSRELKTLSLEFLPLPPPSMVRLQMLRTLPLP